MLAAAAAKVSILDVPFVVDQSALVSAMAGNADLVFLHGIGEGAAGGANRLDAVRTRSPFLNEFAAANFRLIAPQLADREERWGDRLDDLEDLIVRLRPATEDQIRPLFLCGFSIGGAGVVDAVNRFGSGNGINVAAWSSVDAALPGGVPLPVIDAAAQHIRHLLVCGPYGIQRADTVVLPNAHPSLLSHHVSVARQVFEEARELLDGKNLYEWLLT